MKFNLSWFLFCVIAGITIGVLCLGGCQRPKGDPNPKTYQPSSILPQIVFERVDMRDVSYGIPSFYETKRGEVELSSLVKGFPNDGQCLVLENNPHETLIPIRALAMAMGKEVSWDSKENEVVLDGFAAHGYYLVKEWGVGRAYFPKGVAERIFGVTIDESKVEMNVEQYVRRVDIKDAE